MHTWFLVISLLLAGPLTLTQSSAAETKKKTKINTQLFEQEGEATSVSGKVKVVREIQEETEVFIDNPKGSSGPFVLPANIANRAGLLKILNKSQKPGGPPVVLSVDGQQRITNVEASTPTAHPMDL